MNVALKLKDHRLFRWVTLRLADEFYGIAPGGSLFQAGV